MVFSLPLCIFMLVIIMNDSIVIGFIGAGRTCNSLALNLSKVGYLVNAVSSRTRSSSEYLSNRIDNCQSYKHPQRVVDNCNLVFITTPDDSIEKVIEQIKCRPGLGVVHCSGVESSALLKKAQSEGAYTASFHPMQTFPSIDEVISLKNIAFAIEGEVPLTDKLKDIAINLGGFHVEIDPAYKELYHASGFLVCGLMTGLIQQSIKIWEVMGYTENQALNVLAPIIRSTIESISQFGISDSLTGPISRGDVGTIQKHLDILTIYSPETLPIYCHIALSTVGIATRNGLIDAFKKSTMENLLYSRICKIT